jgi:hypothetical protein
MSAYIKRLNAAVAVRARTRRDEEARAATHAAQATRERLKPLENRLARLLETIPLKAQREGYRCQPFRPRCVTGGAAIAIQVRPRSVTARLSTRVGLARRGRLSSHLAQRGLASSFGCSGCRRPTHRKRQAAAMFAR